ncbi:hypothetical protein BB561_000436 [Smittium simulii]|uniref:Importin N-terminal domain-containing protein n=1 Tax=Smittium simulii TaxID=133385 RepID=A0A2T9YZA9_9FUNG|nr:hypothetical protein BB561_000436 [Smittium simulii]
MSLDTANLEQMLPLFQNLMENLLSADNDARSQAEKVLNQDWAIAQPNSLMLGLSYAIINLPDPNIRGFAAVLLRRISLKESFDLKDEAGNEIEETVWSRSTIDTRAQVKALLLTSLEKEADNSVRIKVCDSISEIANSEDEWPELLQALLVCSSVSSPPLRESAYRIFAGYPQILMDQDSTSVKTAFINAFQDEDNNVRLAAFKAAVQVLMIAEDELKNKLESVIPQMLSVLELLFKNQEETGLVECLSSLTELVEIYPKAFRPVLSSLVEFTLLICSNDQLENATKQISFEVLVTLAEAAPGICRKQSQFCEKLVPIALDMMSQIEDDDSWFSVENLEDEDENEVSDFGEQALDRLACSLGGKQLLPTAFQHIPTMLNAPEWQKRHAALMAISAIAEGSYKIMKGELQNILTLICQYFKDAHPRVRYAACHALGQLSTDFSPTIQEKYHSLILQHLIPAMDDVQYPRVQAHAAAAMINFTEETRKSIIEPYLDTLFERLMKLLSSNSRYVQEQAITTIATVAESAQELFRKHYSSIFPQLLNALENAQGKELRLFRGKAIECATFIAIAVGNDVFRPDAMKLIEILVNTQNQVVDDDDPQTSYLLAAWARLCKVMGQEFLPYLPTVMPPLLKSASLKPDFAVVDADEDTSLKYSSEDGWEFATISGQQVGIRTSVLEEKCTAIEMLICYARELGPGFEPYSKQVLELVVPMLKFYFHEGVKYASAAAIPPILESMKSFIVQQSNSKTLPDEVIASKTSEFTQTWGIVCDSLLKAITNEMDDLAYVSQLLTSFADCVEIVGESCLNEEQMTVFFERVKGMLNNSLKQIDYRVKQFKSSETYDEEDIRVISEDETNESEAMDSLSKAMRLVLKTCTASYISHFDQIIPTLSMFANPEFINESCTEDGCYSMQWFLCVFDDLIELTGPASWTYSQYFLPTMINCLSVSYKSDVRQAAAYGIGVAAQYGGSVYANAVAQSIPNLANLITDPESRNDDNIFATENVVSALVKILMYNAGSLSSFDETLLLWFNGLPIINDEDEASFSYNYLLQILQNNETLHNLLNNYTAHQQSNLTKNKYVAEQTQVNSAQLKYLSEISNGLGILHLVHILVDVLVQGILDAELANKLASALQSMVQSCPEETQSALWVCIDSEKKQSLRLLGYA